MGARATAESPKKLGMLLARPKANSAIKPKNPRTATAKASFKKTMQSILRSFYSFSSYEFRSETDVTKFRYWEKD